MKNSNFVKIAFASALLGSTAVGCTSTTKLFAPSAASKEAKAERVAAKAATKAEKMLKKAEYAKAIGYAEAAVLAEPRDAPYRVLLGRAYLAGGRFASASQSFQDAIDLGDTNGKTRLNLALAQIAQGHNNAAIDSLNQARDSIPAADYGLGLALAGNVEQAVQVLEQASHSTGAGARERQNLALSYAMAGRWGEARSTAAQDIPAADLKARMEQWSAFVRPQTPADQVAGVLKVTPHQDAGQPTQLALANFPGQALAAADPAPVETYAPAPVSETSFAAAADVAAPTPEADTYYGAVETAAVDAPVIQAVAAPIKQKVSSPKSIVSPSNANYIKPTVAGGKQGKYVVQLGAFTKGSGAAVAWSRALSKHDELSGMTSLVASAKGGKVFRLSAGGFTSRSDADALCSAIKHDGGTCFVRASLGDKPVQWAVKPTSKGKSKLTQVASR